MSTYRDTEDKNAKGSSRTGFRYIYRGVCDVIITAIASAMFLFVWINYVYDNNHTGYLLGIGNVGMALIVYLLLFIIFGRFLKAFSIGVERKTKQIASIILVLGLTNIVEILVSIIILNNFRYVFDFTWRYALLTVCQSLVLSVITVIMIELYKRWVKPLPVVLIYGD